MSRDPKIGEILLYTLTSQDVARINDLSSTTDRRFLANPHYSGQVLPFIACNLWPGEYPGNAEPFCQVGVNGQLVLDGGFSLWITSIRHGEGQGAWMYQV